MADIRRLDEPQGVNVQRMLEEKKFAEQLKDSGQINVLDRNGISPLTHAIRSNNYEQAKCLIDAGANIYLTDRDGRSALRHAGKTSSNEQLSRLFIRKVEKDCGFNKQMIAKRLIEAKWILPKILLVEEVDVTKYAFERGYDLNILTDRDDTNRSALRVAVENADVDNVKLSLTYVPLVNYGLRYRTALSFVYDSSTTHPKRRLEILELLLGQLSKSDIKNCKDFDRLLNYADKEGIDLILKYHVHLLSNPYAIHWLAPNKKPGVFELLNYTKSNVNVRDSRFGKTALMLAANVGNFPAVELLINFGADINASDNLNRTALFYAIENVLATEEEKKQCVCILLQNGADSQYSPKYRRIQTMIDLENKVEVVNIVLADIALQEFKGTCIIPEIRDKIDANNRIKDYFEQCKQQLSIKFYESVKISDLLIASEKKLLCYARNEEFVLMFEDHKWQMNDSYYYNFSVNRRLRKAIESMQLRREAGVILCRFMKMSYERFPLIAEQILNHLDEQNVKTFIGAFVQNLSI